MRDLVLIGLVMSTLFIKELWKLEPDSEELLKMFPYSDQLITRQTYYWFFCFYGNQLIIVHSWYEKFDKYSIIFSTWFVFQILEVVEYYYTYNEPQFFIRVFWSEELFGLTVVKLKYIAVVTSFFFNIWKTSRYQDGQF